MCTCINILMNNNTLFGRNMDLDYSFNEKIIITPRKYNIKYKKVSENNKHYAILGIGTIIENYPLYADAINEYGLGISMLNFPDLCCYYDVDNKKINIAPYELPLYLLSKCKSLKEVKNLIKDINIVNIDFSNLVPVAPLHFMISDSTGSIVIECRSDKMHIYNNKYNVLTNNPSFDYHCFNLANYMHLHNDTPLNNINSNLDIYPYSYGLGAYSLPGDFSSTSRFIKAFFVKEFMTLNNEENHNINQFFKCLESVRMVKGVVRAKYGFEYTRYTSCYNLNSLTLSYKTYDNDIIKKVSLNSYDLNNDTLINVDL